MEAFFQAFTKLNKMTNIITDGPNLKEFQRS